MNWNTNIIECQWSSGGDDGIFGRMGTIWRTAEQISCVPALGDQSLRNRHIAGARDPCMISSRSVEMEDVFHDGLPFAIGARRQRQLHGVA